MQSEMIKSSNVSLSFPLLRRSTDEKKKIYREMVLDITAVLIMGSLRECIERQMGIFRGGGRGIISR